MIILILGYICELIKFILKIAFAIIKWTLIITFVFYYFVFYGTYCLITGKKMDFGENKVKTKYTVKTDKNFNGRDYEIYCANRLSKAGYKNVTLTQQSCDYGADIVAFDKHGTKVCFQCKYYSSYVGIAAVQEVLASLPYYKASRGVVITNSRFTNAAISLAKEANIKLIEDYI